MKKVVFSRMGCVFLENVGFYHLEKNVERIVLIVRLFMMAITSAGRISAGKMKFV
jgi:hypothetical protein